MPNKHEKTAPQWAWGVKGITPTEKLVLLAMASSLITIDGITEVSIETLSDVCILLRKFVNKAIRHLHESGLIERFKREKNKPAYRLRLQGKI